MHTKPLSKLGLALLLALGVGCKKAAAPVDAGAATQPAPAVAPAAPADAGAADAGAAGIAATDAGAAAPAKRPEPFAAFEAMLLPLVREPASDARSKKTCAAIEELRIQSLAAQRNPPAGVDAQAWEEASAEMRGAFHGMGATCTDDPPSDLPDLDVIHESYKKLAALLPR